MVILSQPITFLLLGLRLVSYSVAFNKLSYNINRNVLYFKTKQTTQSSYRRTSISMYVDEKLQPDYHIYNNLIFYKTESTLSLETDSTVIDSNHLTYTRKPPLLYLPGLDGSGNYSTQSLLNLTRDYDVWRLIVRPNDRSRFLEVAAVCNQFILEVLEEPVVLVGER